MSEHVLDRLSAFLDEELPAREQSAVEGHLRDCSACAAHLERLRSVDAMARALPLAAPDGYFDALPGRIRKRLENSKRPASRGVPVWTWAVAAALVLGVVTPLTMRQDLPMREATLDVPPAPPTYPAPAAAAPDPEAGFSARLEIPAPAEARKAQGKLKDDSFAPQSRKPLPLPLGEEKSVDRPAAAPPAASSMPHEARAKKEADELELAHAGEATAPPAPGVMAARRAEPGGPYAQQQAPLPAAPAFAEAPVEAPTGGAPSSAGERRADRNEAARDEELAKESPARSRQLEGAAASGRVSSSLASSDERIFRRLQEATIPTTLAALRERREAWRSFTREYPSSPRADEARVRVVETGAEAWRVGQDPADLARTREDAAAYLARRDAARAAHVRALLETLPPRP
jgi:hypothetical protein